MKGYDLNHFRTSQCELYIDVDCRNLRDLFESQKHEYYSRQRQFWTDNFTKRNASIPHTLAGTYLSKIEPLSITHEKIRLGANVFKKSSFVKIVIITVTENKTQVSSLHKVLWVYSTIPATSIAGNCGWVCSCNFFPDIISAQTWWTCWPCSRSLPWRIRRRSWPGDSSTAPRGCKQGIFMHLRHCLCFFVCA